MRRIPRLFFDPDLWQAMVEKRGEQIASFDLADAVISIAPPYADRSDVQKAIDEVLLAATGGRIAIRLVPESCETAYLIGGKRFALEEA